MFENGGCFKSTVSNFTKPKRQIKDLVGVEFVTDLLVSLRVRLKTLLVYRNRIKITNYSLLIAKTTN